MTDDKLREIAEAATRVQNYVRMRAEKPLRNLDDTIHGIHTGTQWAAELRLSDISLLLSDKAGLEARVRDTSPDGLTETPRFAGLATPTYQEIFDAISPSISTGAPAKAARDVLALLMPLPSCPAESGASSPSAASAATSVADEPKPLDWKSRALASEARVLGLEEALKDVQAKHAVVRICMESSGWWTNNVGYLTDAALWLDKADQVTVAALSLVHRGEGEEAASRGSTTSEPRQAPNDHGKARHSTAWLIEWPAGRQMPVRYWHPIEGHVIDPNDAVRFCREEDAAAVCKRDRISAGARPVEHKWLDA